MTSILRGFAYGNLPPEAQPFHRNSEYNKAMQLLTRNEEYLLERLSEEEKILFEKYINAQDELNRLTAVENLTCGCKLGATMTAEVFIKMDDLLQHGGSR